MPKRMAHASGAPSAAVKAPVKYPTTNRLIEALQGASLVLGVAESDPCALVQGAGPALRITAPALRRELRRSPAQRRVPSRYVHVLMARRAQVAVCIRFHLIGKRLARWPLMTHDRAHADTFFITYPFLASMLGVRREASPKPRGCCSNLC